MWSDALLDAERQHLLRLLFWSALSILSATTIGVLLSVRRIQSPLLTHFALQMLIWGVVFGAIAAVEIGHLHRRDLSGAVQLDRMLWMNIGLDIGYVAIGGVLALAGRILVRGASSRPGAHDMPGVSGASSMAAIGGGIAIVVQGLALLVIDLQFAALVSR